MTLRVIDKAILDDGSLWCTCVCTKEIVVWLKSLDPKTKEKFFILDHITHGGGNIVDMHESIYMLAKLKYN